MPTPRLTPAEYLEIERKAEFKSEYLNGEMFAMSGGSRYHAWIASQLGMLVQQHLRRSRCVTYTADTRVLTPGGLFTYPDLSVACGEQSFHDKEADTFLNPVILVEILSPSTEGYDRGKKAEMYRAIPSLRELVFISQDRAHVEVLRRNEGGPWMLYEADGLESSIELPSISYQLRLRELYEIAIEQDDSGRFGAVGN